MTRVAGFGEDRDDLFAAQVVDIVLAGVRARFGDGDADGSTEPALQEVDALEPEG
jgi:hypothetical protein